jgi:hypothetical protein
MRHLIAAISFLVLPSVFSQAATVARPQLHPAAPCLPPAEFSLSGLSLYQSEATARKALGRPLRVTREQGEDDGGIYTATVLHYRRLKVEIVRGVVDRIYSGSARVSTPSGVRPGMKFEDVRRVLGKGPEAIGGRAYRYGPCDEGHSAYFDLKFNSRMVVSTIDISADRP